MSRASNPWATFQSPRLLLFLGLLAGGCPGTEGDLLVRVPMDLAAPADLSPLLQCITDVLGDATACETEMVWNDRAKQACTASGGVLSGAGAFEPCSGGFRHLKYACCPTSMTGCVAEKQGGASSCKDEATWRKNAELSCSASGTVVMGLELIESCGTGVYRYVKYLCCPST